MLPSNWSVQTLGEVVTIGSGQVDPRAEPYSSMLHIGAEDIESGTGRILTPRSCRELALISGKYEFDEAAIVYSKIRPNLNKVCFPGFRGVCSADAYPIWPDTSLLSPQYLKISLLSEDFVRRAVACSMRTGMPKVNREDLLSLTITIPTLPEQQQISKIALAWDSAIEIAEKLLANGRKQREALTYDLLMGRFRHPDFATSSERVVTRVGRLPKDWKHVPIGELASEVSIKNVADETLPVLSCTKHRGLVDSLSYFKKRVFSENTTTYKVVPRGSFAYATNHIDEGSIGYQGLYDRALISPMYTVFNVEGAVDHGYLFKLLKTEHYRQVFAANTSASVDRRGSLRWSEFKKIEIPVPPMAEQLAIGKILDAAEQEIEQLSSQVAMLQAEKRALMQDLLTGKRRVKLETPP